jgi:hypothetical protein
MPTLTPDCKEEFSEWKESCHLEVSQNPGWDRTMVAAVRKAPRSEWSDLVRKQYESARRALRVFQWHNRSRSETDTVARLFYQHAERWKRETTHWSSVTKMIAHPSYLRIIGLANRSERRKLVRLLLRELENEPDYWFDALVAITGRNPVQPEQDFDEAVNSWLEWGRQEGIL